MKFRVSRKCACGFSMSFNGSKASLVKGLMRIKSYIEAFEAQHIGEGCRVFKRWNAEYERWSKQIEQRMAETMRVNEGVTTWEHK